MPDFAIKAAVPGMAPLPKDPAPEWWTGDEWETPQAIVDALEKEFGAFDLDPCARDETAKAANYFTKDDDGLAQPWFGQVYVNPPYSDPGPWVAKALEEVGRATTYLLLPAATDTGWFHDLVLAKCNVRFWRGRIKFLGWHGKTVGSPTAGSLLVRVPWKVPDGKFHL
jgi:phage N-6-adenine-methyltransferase